MSRNIFSLKLLASVVVMGLASLNFACTQSPNSASNVRAPLPSDSYSANPASPNCYPDVNHCASYSTGGVSKDNPTQQK